MLLGHHMRALGREDLPSDIILEGNVLRLVETFKHTFVTAVGVYEREGERVVLKCYRKAPLFGIPMAWAGRLMAAHEAAVMRQVEDIEGVPRFRGRYDSASTVRDYVPGAPLRRDSKVGEEFFPGLFRLLRELHARGLAYVDLEKAANILVGDDGRPYLVDFQLAFRLPGKFLGRTRLARALRHLLQQADLYHARKHFRRVMRERLTDEQIARLRPRPWFVRVANLIYAPFKKLRRRILRKG